MRECPPRHLSLRPLRCRLPVRDRCRRRAPARGDPVARTRRGRRLLARAHRRPLPGRRRRGRADRHRARPGHNSHARTHDAPPIDHSYTTDSAASPCALRSPRLISHVAKNHAHLNKAHRTRHRSHHPKQMTRSHGRRFRSQRRCNDLCVPVARYRDLELRRPPSTTSASASADIRYGRWRSSRSRCSSSISSPALDPTGCLPAGQNSAPRRDSQTTDKEDP
jgi:hypothetical protein